MSNPKYPNCKVQLSGEDGNAFALVGAVSKALRNYGIPRAEVDKFASEALSGDYDHVLQTCMEYVEVN